MKKIFSIKNLIFILILGMIFIYLFFNLFTYLDYKKKFNEEINENILSLSGFVKDIIEENLKKSYYLEKLYYEKFQIDFKNQNYLNNNKKYIKLDNNFNKINGNLNINLSEEEKEILELIYSGKIKLLELRALDNEIYLAGYYKDNIYISKYLIEEDIKDSFDIEIFLYTYLQNYNCHNIKIKMDDEELLEISDDKKVKYTKKAEEELIIEDFLNDSEYVYTIEMIFDITKEIENINNYFYDFIFTILITIVITVLIILYSLYQSAYIKNQEMLKTKEKEILMGSMAAGVAHEIRNPLNAINYSIEYLKAAIKEKDYIENFEMIKKEIQRINIIIEEFLNIRKEISLNRVEFNINKIIYEVVNIFKNELDNKGIKIKIIDKNYINYDCDVDKMKEVLINIIKNSIEALENTKKKHIMITIENNRIIIKDNGCGMLPQEKNNIFNLYFTTKKNGNGIGMYRSKKILEAHNISIKVFSKKEKGTEFYLKLGGKND